MSLKQKRTLRDEMKRVLSHLDERWVKAASKELCANLTRLVNERLDARVQHILAWTPYYQGEPDLTAFIESHIGRRQVYLPLIDAKRSLSFLAVDERWQQSHHASGEGSQLEPPQGKPFDFAEADRAAVLVPALAFDRQGVRLGRGRMHYESFFRKPELRDTTTIGIAWSLQLVTEVPAESHDLAVDWVCTETEFFTTGMTSTDDLAEE